VKANYEPKGGHLKEGYSAIHEAARLPHDPVCRDFLTRTVPGVRRGALTFW